MHAARGWGRLAGVVIGLGAAGAAWADVSIGIHVATPAPPPVVLTAPPPLVVVPGTPVFYAPGVPYNLFFHGGRYYLLHGEVWFSAVSHAGPWVFVAAERVPAAVLAVPVKYYKVPPGHRKGGGRPPWAGHGRP